MGRTDPKVLTALERRFLLLYAQHEYNGMRTARAMWPKKNWASDNAAASYASRILSGIKAKLGNEFWEHLGLDDERIARVYREATDAQIVKPMLGPGGAILEAGPYVDHPTRVRAADSLAKLRGLNAPDKVEHLTPVPVTDATKEKLKRLTDDELAKFEALLEKLEGAPDAGAGPDGEGGA